MHIVIDMPKTHYDRIVKEGNGYFEGLIKNGTPLPKGHGKLIDADELKKHKYHDNDRFENAVSVAQIDWADTIIEADSAESEVENK